MPTEVRGFFRRPATACCAIAVWGWSLAIWGAPITWGPATNTTGKSQLVEGTVILAVSGGTGATVTGGGAVGNATYSFTGVNYTNLTFTPTPAVGTLADASNGASSTGDSNFDTVVKSLTYTGSANITSGTQTITGLTNGTQYKIQVFYNDQRSGLSTRVMTFGDGASPAHTVNLTAGGSGWGQHAVGTFTATGTTQSLTHASNGFANVHFNAILVTQAGPPPAPDVPTGLVATVGDTAVSLDWNDNLQFGFANFIVRRATTAGGPYADIPGATPTASSYTDTGLTNGTTYYYVVAARNSLGQISANSAESFATPEVFVPPAPQVPANLTVAPGNHQNLLNWDDNTQPGFREFRIKRSTAAGGSPPGSYTQIATTNNSIYTDTTALNDTTYYYVVTAVNTANEESAPSAERSGTPKLSASPPNFLFIITDDQDTYAVGAYRRSEPAETGPGGTPYVIRTPNIDRLAAEGMLFHQARLMGADSGAVCLPSRTCIMTGKNTWQRTSGVTAAVTFPGIFNRGVRSGASSVPYATYRTCKSGNTYATANNEFTVVNDADKRGNTDGSGSEWHGDWAVNYIQQWNTAHRPNNKPFLIYLGFSHPHDERLARTTPNLTGLYRCVNTTNPASIILNPNAPPLPFNHLSCTPATYPAHPFDHGDLDVRDEISVSGFGQYRTEAVVRNEIGRNFACVDWIDQQIGRVLATLEDPNGDGNQSDSVIDNTYIVFTSDHGIAIGRHGLQGKQNLYEHTWRVPYIVRGPGIAVGTETNALIYLHDTFPTLCDLAGLDLPPTIDGNDGRSFRNVLENSATTARDRLFGIYAGGDKPGIRAITDGRFKIIKYDVAANATQVTQMFDLATNPFELLPEHGVSNIATAPAYARIRARLEERLMAERQLNADPYQFLGDRTLLRFEDGPAGATATTLQDRFAWDNDGTANGGVFTADAPYSIDRVNGETNTLSLRLAPGNSVSIPDDRALDMGTEPFTLEAYVKLETLPGTGNAIPVVGKGTDYVFYAGGGSLGNPNKGLTLRLGASTIHSNLAITDRNWHYLSAAVDPVADTVRFVLDNQVQTISSSAVGTTNNDPVTLAGGAFDGYLDEVSITVGFLKTSELQPVDPTPPGPFRITGWDFSSESEFSLTFQSEETRLYTVQKSPNLHAGSWTDVRSFVSGTAGTTTIDNLPREPGNNREFYRVVVAE